MRSLSIKIDLGAGAMLTAGLGVLLAAQSPFPAGPPLAGIAVYALLATLLLVFRSRHRRLGWANRVTLLRASITCALAGALVQPALFVEQGRLIATLALIALALDGLDGWLARRLNETSDFGARFDMETDAAIILVLCWGLWLSGLAPFWVLAIGLFRPAFVAAGLALPWLTRPLPERFRRKMVCVIQIAVLPAALLPIVPEALRLTLLAAALLALAISFAIDIAWLFRRRQAATHTQWRSP